MHSLSKGLVLFARLEWGLGDVKSLGPSSFSGTKNGKTINFTSHTSQYDKDYMVELPHKDGSDYIVLFIPNKEGDNVVMMDSKECQWGEKVSMQWISKRIKYKTRFSVTSV